MLLLATAWWAFLVVAAAQPSCDPETQYESGGACCMMCGPGTSMLPSGTCSNPQCKDCEENEYQDKYTQEPKCLRQPYCDPNKNFEVTTHLSKKVQSTCLCRTGFHCSSEACITCVQHTECGPGHEVVSKGNHTYDTVCRKCPEGTFSNNSVVCQKWTKCGIGYYIVKEGTAQSDIICEKSERIHVAVICVIFLGIFLLIAGLFYCWCKGNVKDSVKGCVESCRGEEQTETPREIYIPIADMHEPEHKFVEQFSTQEEGSTQEGHGMTPEENLDEESLEQSSYPRTENGNFVTQERGKSEVLSRQESQTQTPTFTGSFFTTT
ncbi:tumor necrosis factor receptor superfamily member 5 [Channa argus]|uniref:tumor necrosis factor receptor superfamily member 5 n=1 Tax=Channa argus TaxID=215402 RepID=UPI00294820DE|nr:hypothetical protein Q8A73_013590 [Channa argus]